MGIIIGIINIKKSELLCEEYAAKRRRLMFDKLKIRKIKKWNNADGGDWKDKRQDG